MLVPCGIIVARSHEGTSEGRRRSLKNEQQTKKRKTNCTKEQLVDSETQKSKSKRAKESSDLEDVKSAEADWIYNNSRV